MSARDDFNSGARSPGGWGGQGNMQTQAGAGGHGSLGGGYGSNASGMGGLNGVGGGFGSNVGGLSAGGNPTGVRNDRGSAMQQLNQMFGPMGGAGGKGRGFPQQGVADMRRRMGAGAGVPGQRPRNPFVQTSAPPGWDGMTPADIRRQFQNWTDKWNAGAGWGELSTPPGYPGHPSHPSYRTDVQPGQLNGGYGATDYNTLGQYPGGDGITGADIGGGPWR